MSEKSAKVGLQSILESLLAKISEGRTIVLSSLDGVELSVVSKSMECKDDDRPLLNSFSAQQVIASNQAVKLGLGSPEYTMTWVSGVVLVQSRVDNLLVSLVVGEQSNLGRMEDYLRLLQKILQPFGSAEFLETA